MAISNLTTDSKCEEAWKSKLEQTYHKAKLSFGNTTEFEYIDNLYDKTINLGISDAKFLIDDAILFTDWLNR